jgi:hypothetical protein
MLERGEVERPGIREQPAGVDDDDRHRGDRERAGGLAVIAAAQRGHDRQRAERARPDARDPVVRCRAEAGDRRRRDPGEDGQRRVRDQGRADVAGDRRAPERARVGYQQQRERDLGDGEQLWPGRAVDDEPARRQQPQPAAEQVVGAERGRRHDRIVGDGGDRRQQRDGGDPGHVGDHRRAAELASGGGAGGGHGAQSDGGP